MGYSSASAVPWPEFARGMMKLPEYQLNNLIFARGSLVRSALFAPVLGCIELLWCASARRGAYSVCSMCPRLAAVFLARVGCSEE